MNRRLGRPHTRRGRATSDLGDVLTGERVEVGDVVYRIDEVLKQHNDRSFAFRAVDLSSNRDVVLRTVDRETKAFEKLGPASAGLIGRHGLAAYDGYGTFDVTNPAFKLVKDSRLTLYALVRNFEVNTLDSVVHQQDLTSVNALGYLNDVAHGIHALHSNDMVVESLRPTNVLLSPTGARIADYGLGHLDQLSKSSSVRRFKSPDQLYPDNLRSTSRDDARAADLWAFGRLANFLNRFVVDDDGWDRQRLDGVVSRCIDTDPRRRPAIETVLEDLFEERGHFVPRFQSFVCWESPGNLKFYRCGSVPETRFLIQQGSLTYE